MKKYKLEDKTSKYKELDKNFGGIITWILKLSKQYELKIDAKKLENEVITLRRSLKLGQHYLYTF